MFNKQMLFYALLFMIIPVTAYSRPGRTDAYSGHTNKRNGEYNNHSKQKANTTSKKYDKSKSKSKISRSQSIFSGKVASVADGDTIKILPDKPFPINYLKKIKVSLAEIDAPEKGQACGKHAKKVLANLVVGKMVTVVEVNRDKRGRIVGHVNAHGIDVNTEMVRIGYAWVRQKYVNKNLYNLEDNAKKAKIGLWAEANPIPPWEWRKANGKKINYLIPF
jgi:micrococcal nuclease